MKVFPAWAEHLGLNAVMRGIDFPPNSDPALYREAVAFTKYEHTVFRSDFAGSNYESDEIRIGLRLRR